MERGRLLTPWPSTPPWRVRLSANVRPRARVRETSCRDDIGWVSQQHASVTAVRIVTVDAQSFHCRRVTAQEHKFLMAGETYLLLRHFQNQCGHVALGLRQMANGACNRHGGVH
jgi:hypothetical protein